MASLALPQGALGEGGASMAWSFSRAQSVVLVHSGGV